MTTSGALSSGSASGSPAGSSSAPSAAVASFAPRGLTPVEESDRRLGEACANAAGSLMKRADVSGLLLEWHARAGAHLDERGFKLAPGTPLVAKSKSSFGQTLSVSHRIFDRLCERPLALRLELFAASHKHLFGRLDAKAQLVCSATRSRIGRSSAHCLHEMELFRAEPNELLVQFGGLTERLFAHLRNAAANCRPGGIDAALLEFSQRVDDALAP